MNRSKRIVLVLAAMFGVAATPAALAQSPWKLDRSGPRWRSKLVQDSTGRELGPSDIVVLQNGQKVTAELYQAFLDSYVEKLRKKGLLDRNGKAASPLDRASVDRTLAAARKLQARTVAMRAGTKPVPKPSTLAAHVFLEGDRPPVPGGRGDPPIRRRWNATFGDTNWMGVTLDAETIVGRASFLLTFSQRLDATAWLPLGGLLPPRHSLVSGQVAAHVASGGCWTTGFLSVLGQTRWTHPSRGPFPTLNEAISTPNPVVIFQPVWETTVLAVFVPINFRANVIGTAGVSSRAILSTRWNDPRSSGVLFNTLNSQPVNFGDRTYEGIYADVAVQAFGGVRLSTQDAVNLLTSTGIDLPGALGRAARWIANRFNIDLGHAQAYVSASLVNFQLKFWGFESLTYLPGTGTYSISGVGNSELVARVLSDPAIGYSWAVQLPIGVTPKFCDLWFIPVPCGVSVEYLRASDQQRLWGYTGSAFEATVPLLNNETWRKDIGR